MAVDRKYHLYRSPADNRVDDKTYSKRLGHAVTLAAHLKGEFTQGRITCWNELEKYGVSLDRITPTGEPWKTRDARIESAWQLAFVLDNYFTPRFPFWGEEDLLKAEQESAVIRPEQKRLRLTPQENCFKFPTGLQLFPEQDPVVEEILDKWHPRDGSEPVQHILCPGGTGSGKTIIGAAVLFRSIHERDPGLMPEFPIPLLYENQWATVPNAVEQTKRECERVGMGNLLGSNLHVYGYNSLSSSDMLGRLTEEVMIEPEEDPFADPDAPKTERQRIIRWLLMSAPRRLLVDECHKLANPDSNVSRTFATLKQVMDSLPFKLRMRSLWMSATPFEKVVDSKSFVTFAGIKYGGALITPQNFNTLFARDIANGAPTVVTAASMDRLFGAIRRNVVEIPYIKWKYRSVNSVTLVDFENEADRQYVNQAWDRHLERCAALGKETPQGMGAVYASFTIFRNDVEHVRIPQVVRMMHDAVNKQGRSAVCGTAFTGAIVKGVFTLIDEYGVDPNRISVIWGGRQNIKPERILSATEMFEIVQEAMTSGNGLSIENKRLIKRNLEWQKDALLFGDGGQTVLIDGEEKDKQELRYKRLQRLGLIGIQTREKRQYEIDKMQSGQALYCFFTMASGGTGLSLPHCDDRQHPRSSWMTPIYSGKEFTQAFGRCPRRNSVSDSLQTCVLLRGTIESEHVAPILDNKLQAAGAFTSKKTDLMGTLSQLFVKDKERFYIKREFGDGAVRTLEQAIKDSEDEKTQVHFSDTVEDDDDDE